MKSGDPQPINDLQLVIETKRHLPARTVDTVSEAARWLKSALKGAQVNFRYASCEERDHYGFAAFTVIRSYKDAPVCLELKVAEIRDTAYVFAEVLSLGGSKSRLFPFFGEMQSESGRELLLHYMADFVISTAG